MRPSRAAIPSRVAAPAVRRAAASAVPALLGAWLAAKQILWSPGFQAGAPVPPGALAASVAVALLVVAVATRFRGRARTLAFLAPAAALSGIHQVHLLYHRQYSELASLAALAYAPQLAQVGGAVVALLRPADALLWADVALLAAALVVRGDLPAGSGPRRPIALSLAALALLAAPALPFLDRPLAGPRRLGVTRAEVADSLNVAGYQLFDAATFARRRLGGARAVSLEEVSAHHAARPPPTGPLTGTQRGRNVVVVQLESAQAFAVGMRVSGAPVTPVLDRLARESLSFTRAFAQVGQGTTSDAELLAGCSLHPLEVGAVFTERYDVDLRCLPELLREAGYHTVAMHANWPNFWNRDRMYPTMGYDRFFSIRDFDREPVVGLGLSDVRFFEQAAERLASLPEPFYALLVSLSHHAPFVDPNLPRTLPLGELAGTEVGDYLDSLRFADAALGELLRGLSATGLLERSVLVVYGDHHGVSRNASGTARLGLPTGRGDVWLVHEQRVPLLVRLPGGEAAGERSDPAGLVDVPPTLVDLLGVRVGPTFFHGRSLVSDRPRPVVLADGSAVSEGEVLLAPSRRWGPPGCLDATTGATIEDERCEALAAHAQRELAISRAAVDRDLFRWMVAAPSPDRAE